MPKRKAADALDRPPKKGVARKIQIVIAHAAGHHPAGAKHPSMAPWLDAFKSIGTVHDGLVYPRPFNLMPRLVDAHAKVIGTAAKAGPVVLVGVGMGARVAVHLLSGSPGDDGKPLAPVASELKASVCACVAVDYPLLRVGTREVRAAPLLSLEAGAPPMLFVRGPGDKHMDASKLPLQKMQVPASELIVANKSESPSNAEMEQVVDWVRCTASKLLQ